MTLSANDITLTQQELAFCSHFFASGNRTQSALAAGYPKASAARIGSRLAKNRAVIEKVGALRSIAIREASVKAEMIVSEMSAIGFARVTDVFNDDGTTRPISEWPDAVHAAIKHVEFGYVVEKRDKSNTVRVRAKTYLKKIVFHDKKAALDKLGDYLRMWSQPASAGIENEADMMRSLLARIAKQEVRHEHGGVPPADIAATTTIDVEAS